MSILDYIRNLFKSNKKIARIITQDLIKTKGETEPLEVGLYEKKTPLIGKNVIITINDVGYNRKTNDDGIAKLNINLPVGEYDTHISFEDPEYEYTSTYCKVTVNPVLVTQNLDMVEHDGSKFKAYIQSSEGDNLSNAKVIFNINGVNYSRTTDNNGLAVLNINLQAGDYEIKTSCVGVSCTNSIHISPAPTPTPEPSPEPTECTNPYESSPHPTKSGCNGMGQNNSTCCGPSAVHKILYKFGIRDITQGQLSSWMGTGSSGTSHSGIETGIAKVNQVKGTNISVKWYNLSELNWEKIGKIICQPNKAALCHILYQNGGTCDGSGYCGHYELLTRVNTRTGYVQVLNSLGGYCGDCYCGYYQDRRIACQETFISGISQKSICVVTMN